MQIFIRTPLYKLSKFIPHLIEHCINRKAIVSSSDYFNYIHNTDFNSFSNYTLLKIPNYFDVNIFLEKIIEKIDKKLIEIEVNVLKQELKNINYINWLYEKICKKIYGSQFNINKISNSKISEIIDYHQKYYQNENIIICDDDYNIINNSYIYTEHNKEKIHIKKQKFRLMFNWYNNYVISTAWTNWKNYYFHFFLEELMNSFIDFKYRFQNNIYHNDSEAYFFRTEELDIFVISWKFDIWFDKDFFDNFKIKFKNIVSFDYWKKWIILCKLLNWENINNKEILNYIDSFTFENMLDFIWNKNDYSVL